MRRWGRGPLACGGLLLFLLVLMMGQTELEADPPVKKPDPSVKKPVPPAASAKRFVDAEGGISLIPPTGWEREGQALPPNIIWVAPHEPNESVNIGVISEAVGALTLDQMIQANRDFDSKSRGLITYDDHSVLLAGVKAHAWRMHIRPPHGEQHEVRQVFCIRNRRSYVITLAALPSSIHRYEADFDRTVASVTWTK